METILKIDLYLHITAGTVALITGMIAIFAKKGGLSHRKAGQWYFWAMLTVCVTAILRFRLSPSIIFLTMIAIFSFYLNFSGKRILNFKKKDKPFQFIDWSMAYFTLSCGIVMCLSSIYYYFFEHKTILSILFVVFGFFCISIARTDILRFKGKIEVEKMNWFFQHIGRMMGSYAATVTAFVITNNHGFFPDLVVWIAPGVIIGFLSDVWANRYRKDYGIPIIPVLPVRIAQRFLGMFKQLNGNIVSFFK
ncbi:hypothetical protein VB796_17480 [Arcicella sp. LKC2W]|uniref:hypothetical protein n=1 Tax=Arcicella sp. LKC2W TaxID=2984198 RepID=UPI002B1ECF53|nr:hypothetical protein [Arcicella sp. LKC2W]MEA5460855.1 hypothetical protein [Arcicella sp. LKC2W]